MDPTFVILGIPILIMVILIFSERLSCWLISKVNMISFGLSIGRLLFRNSFLKTSPPPAFRILPSRRAAELTYDYAGKNYRLLVPYRSRIAPVMVDTSFIAHYGKKSEVLPFQPGIPLLVNADDLGVDRIEIDPPLDEEIRDLVIRA